MQGHLRRKPLTVRVRTECGHCGRPLEIELDGELTVRVLSEGAAPLVFSPFVRIETLGDAPIIDAF